MRGFAKTKIFSLTLAIILGSFGGLFAGHASAQGLTIPANLDWNDGVSACTGTVNGQTQYFYNAVLGDSATFNITNVSSTYTIDVVITETGQATYSKTLA